MKTWFRSASPIGIGLEHRVDLGVRDRLAPEREGPLRPDLPRGAQERAVRRARERPTHADPLLVDAGELRHREARRRTHQYVDRLRRYRAHDGADVLERPEPRRV